MNYHVTTLKALVFLVMSLTVLSGSAGAASASASTSITPRAIVEKFHGNLLAVMKEADALGIKGRYSRLAPEIEQTFDFPKMIKIASGDFWNAASVEQQKNLSDAFTKLSISTYASQFDGFSGEAFETVGESPGPQQTLLVETRILRPQKSPVGITYVLRMNNEQWQIVDVLLDNSISELAVRRSEYRMVLKNSGVDGLVKVLNEKAEAMTAK